MQYALTAPQEMRLFIPPNSYTMLMYRAMRVIVPGEVVKVIQAEIMSYDHRDKLAIKLTENQTENQPRSLPTRRHYVLVEELGGEITRLAHTWTDAYAMATTGSANSMHEGAERRAEIETALKRLISQHVRPDLDLTLRPVDTYTPKLVQGHRVILW